MPEGTNTYKGLAVPLFGESQIFQVTAATDILTLTAITGATGDFLVMQTAGGGEVFVVDASGNISALAAISAAHTVSGVGTYSAEPDFAAGAQVAAGQYLRFSVPPTTPPTTGLEKGDMFVTFEDTNTKAAIAVCVDASGNSLRYIPFGTATFGRATP